MCDWPKTASEHRIGLSTGALYPDYLTEDALDVAAEQHFSVVEIYLQTPGEYTSAFVAGLRQRLAEYDLAAHSLHNDIRHFDLWSPYQRRAAESYALFERLIDIAAELDVQAITWHGFRDHLDDPARLERFAETVSRLGQLAQQHGITLTIENVSWCYVRSEANVERIRSLELPLGFTFDPFQAAEAGVNPAAMIRAMGDQIVTVHLADFGPGPVRHLPLGAGIIDWSALFSALDAVRYTGPLIVETPFRGDLSLLAAGRDFVKRHLANNAGA
jgi:sugar phosphate isomerase/epimerase